MSGLTVVTGAGGGMGAEVARRFADDGMLLLCDISEEKLAALLPTLPGEGNEVVVGDITEGATLEAIVAAVASAGGLARLIHTAGLSPTMADPRRLLDVNLCASVRLTDALERFALDGSVAVLISSIAGHTAAHDRDADLDDPAAAGALGRLAGGVDAQAAYCYSKRGVIRLVEARAARWGRRGARIMSLSPGLIETPMNVVEFEAAPVMAQMLDATPVPRMGRASEIADAVEYLCSPRASFVTGSDLRVDGGIFAVMRTDGRFAS